MEWTPVRQSVVPGMPGRSFDPSQLEHGGLAARQPVGSRGLFGRDRSVLSPARGSTCQRPHWGLAHVNRLTVMASSAGRADGTSSQALEASAALLLADEAVYRRTCEGQRELVCESLRLSAPERRFLATFTGHTPLRVLLDLGLHSAEAGQSIARLVSMGLIQLVEPSAAP